MSNLRIHQGEQVPHLTHLVQKSNYYLEQNDFQYQSKEKHINILAAAGRLIELGIIDIKGSDEYKTYMAKNKHYTPDFYVSILTIPS
jgi:uncharacterized protein YjbK